MLLWLFSLLLSYLHLAVVVLALLLLGALQGAATLLYRLAPAPVAALADESWLHSGLLRRVFAFRLGLGARACLPRRRW